LPALGQVVANCIDELLGADDSAKGEKRPGKRTDLGRVAAETLCRLTMRAVLGPDETLANAAQFRKDLLTHFHGEASGDSAVQSTVDRLRTATARHTLLMSSGQPPLPACLLTALLPSLGAADLRPEQCEQGQLTRMELMEDVLGALGAGTSGMSYTSMALARHLLEDTAWQTAACAAARAVFGPDGQRVPASCDELLTMEVVPDLVRETVRLNPLQQDLARMSLKSGEFCASQLRLAYGPGVFFSYDIFAMQRDPEVFGTGAGYDANRFMPQRWTLATALQRQSIFAFGAGPRACVGMRFVHICLTLFWARLLLHFEIDPVLTSTAPLVNGASELPRTQSIFEVLLSPRH
jgi:cytochrome P450